MNVLLTSAGFETETIKNTFLQMLDKDASSTKVLFIPTAAITPVAIQVLPKCINDLLKCGILEEYITVYDLHRGMDLSELSQYDVVYLCGGNPRYLLERICDTGFDKALMEYISQAK